MEIKDKIYFLNIGRHNADDTFFQYQSKDYNHEMVHNSIWKGSKNAIWLGPEKGRSRSH